MIDLLKTVLDSDAVEAASDVVSAYSVCDKTPRLVVFPKTLSQISQIMLLAKRERQKVIVLGHNNQANFGSTIENPDWCISLHRMRQIVEHEPADLMATVEAGVTLPQLQEFLRPHQQLLPLDPPLTDVSTLGGIVAANAAGPWQLYFGTARDLVLGLRVVLPDGKIVRAGGKTVKNVAGYDLSKLFIGSMGTLGIIGEITVKLFPLPAASQTISVRFKRFDAIPQLIRSITGSNLVITRCEYFNAVLSEKFFDSNASADQNHLVLLSVQGHPEMVTATTDSIRNMVAAAGGSSFEIFTADSEQELWERIRRSNMRDGFIQVQMAVPRSKWGEIVLALENFGKEIAQPLAVQAHAGSGLIHVGWPVAGSGAPYDEERQIVSIDRLRQLAKQEQGWLVVYQAPVAIRTPATIWGEPDDNFQWLQKIKSKYDANQQLVAGRFIGGL